MIGESLALALKIGRESKCQPIFDKKGGFNLGSRDLKSTKPYYCHKVWFSILYKIRLITASDIKVEHYP